MHGKPQLVSHFAEYVEPNVGFGYIHANGVPERAYVTGIHMHLPRNYASLFPNFPGDLSF